MPRKKNDQNDEEPGRAENGEGTVYKGSDGYWHVRLIVGVKDDGSPDRRHRKAKTEKLVREKLRELQALKRAGELPKAGPAWTLERWLTHWVENIAAPTVRDSTADGYRNDVYHHLIPGLGKHRLDRIQPEHFERLYQRMVQSGGSPGNAHHVHRTAKTALNEAVRRRHITRNPVTLAKPPRMEETEIEPYSVDEVRRILEVAAGTRNAARWAIALALGLRQGEVLGLKWETVDLEAGTLRVRENRLRPKYVHGCGDTPCGRKPGYCPEKVNKRKTTGPVKSRAGKRPMGIPAPVVTLLLAQKAAQDIEREQAGELWANEGWVFATPTGEALNPNTDYHQWKELLERAGVREARLHDARHTAATLLLILKVPDRAAQGVMGWSDPTMPARYQHVVKEVQRDIADQMGGLLWKLPTPRVTTESAATETETEPLGH